MKTFRHEKAFKAYFSRFTAHTHTKKTALPSGRRKMAPNGNLCLCEGITSTQCVGSTKGLFSWFLKSL